VSYKDINFKMQKDFKFLIDAGLKTTSTFLDVGCGRGRLAYAIYYLESGNYYGFDKENYVLGFKNKVKSKERSDPSWRKFPKIFKSDLNDFFENIPANKLFDFIYGYSVFTHVTLDSNLNFFINMKKHIHKNSKIYLTFLISKNKSFVGNDHKDRKNEFNGVWSTEEEIKKFFKNLNLNAQWMGSITKNWENSSRPADIYRYGEEVYSPFENGQRTFVGDYGHQDMFCITSMDDKI
jgi:cyclopropane fatty-acyl-phospholipid synthase-like methyltransferase